MLFLMKIVFLFCIKNIFVLFIVVVQRHLHAQQYGREPKPKQLLKKCKLNIFFLIFIHAVLNAIGKG